MRKKTKTPCPLQTEEDFEYFSKELEKEHNKEWRKLWRQGLWQCFSAKFDDSARVNLLYNSFYRFKAIICLLIAPIQSRIRRKPMSNAKYYNSIHPFYFNYRDLYAGWSCNMVTVGKGYFKNWWAIIDSDGDWWM